MWRFKRYFESLYGDVVRFKLEVASEKRFISRWLREDCSFVRVLKLENLLIVLG